MPSEFTLTELVTSVAAVARAAGLPGTSIRSAVMCQDKGWAKRAWLRQSIETPAGGVVRTAAEAREALASLSGPGIIKPVQGFGAIGVRELRAAADVDRYFDDVTGSHVRAWVVEELVDGASHDVNGLFDATGFTSGMWWIKNVGDQSNLDLKSFSPGTLRPVEFYKEFPIEMQVVTRYHDLGLFLDRVSKYSRIINVDNLRISQSRARDKSISASFTATTFVYDASAAAEGVAE